MTLRQRIALLLLPMVALLAVLGGAGVLLLYRLGNSTEAILHDNYRSVLYMERLGEAVERIDSAYVFALLGRDARAKQQYDQSWHSYKEWLSKEQKNITEDGEDELVAKLTELTKRFRLQGEAFFARSAADPADLPEQHAADRGRENDYFDAGGLEDTFHQIKEVSAQILRLNQASMETASREAKLLASHSLLGFAVGLAVAGVLGAWLAWGTTRSILAPIKAVTQSAFAIGAGNLDQVVSVRSRDELGQLAEAFNGMARQLRHYRQSDYARLLRAQRTSQATIDSFPDPVLVVDAEGQVEMANPAANRLLGLVARPDGEAVAVPWQPPEPLREPLAEALSGLRDYLPEGFDRVILLGPNGRERAVLPRILTIRDPFKNLLGAAVLLQDVTRLRLLDQVKSDLVATASHELKTPLTSIRLAVHLLLEEAAGPLTAKQTELLLDARENCERLLAMVNNLLDLARLEQGRRQLDVRPEAPETLLNAAAEAVRPRAQDKGVEVSLQVPAALPKVAVDAARLGNALGNLLDNALQYTDRGGKITLAASAGAEGVTLSVADSGVGIPADHLAQVFEKFFRVPGQSRGGGTGLGLAIVSEIVAAHGGTITCESKEGAGTVFRITLPEAGAGEPVLGVAESASLR